MLNPIIETAIGLIFVYLLLSMVCSSIQEFLAALFGWRAKTLLDGIQNMLDNDTALVSKIYNDPLIKSLARTTWWDSVIRRKTPLPSYIPADLFAKALLNATGIQVADPTVKPNIPANLQASANTQKALQSFANLSPDFNALLANIETWYNNTMDRVSGWYKRKTQSWILVIAAVVTIPLNADTLMLATAFWHDPTLRTATVNAATDYVKNHPAAQAAQQVQDCEQQKAELFLSVTPPGAEKTPPKPEQDCKKVAQAATDLSNTLTDVQAQLTKINLPLGWDCELCTDAANKKKDQAKVETDAKAQQSQNASGENANKKQAEGSNSGGEDKGTTPKPDPCDEQKKAVEAKVKCVRGQHLPDNWRDWLVKIFGLLLTVLALSQGSPFWFDLLQKLVNLRLAGNPPADKKTTTTTTTT
jgi:hypothetical protein